MLMQLLLMATVKSLVLGCSAFAPTGVQIQAMHCDQVRWLSMFTRAAKGNCGGPSEG